MKMGGMDALTDLTWHLDTDIPFQLRGVGVGSQGQNIPVGLLTFHGINCHWTLDFTGNAAIPQGPPSSYRESKDIFILAWEIGLTCAP